MYSVDEIEDDSYPEFLEFYKQTTGSDETDKEKYSNPDSKLEFPRLLQNNIENFQYYSEEKFNKEIKNHSKQLSVLNINIRGIQRNFDNLITYLNSISCKFDIIVLTEAHLQKNAVQAVDLYSRFPMEGYNIFYVESTIKFGGVVMYIKTELEASYCYELTCTSNVCDSLYVKIRTSNKKQLYMGGYYRFCRSNTDDIAKFISQFHNDLKNRKLQKNDIIIAGDFNICLMKSTYNDDSLSFLNTILQHNCECLIFKPTRIAFHKNSLQVKSATILDQIITNLHSYHCTSGNLHYPNSDHHATFVVFDAYQTGHEKDKSNSRSQLFRRNFSNINIENLTDDFSSYDWDSLVYNNQNLDETVCNLDNVLTELCDRHAPLQKMSNRKIKYCTKPYIDKALVVEIKIKNKLHSAYRRNPTECNKNAFKMAKNKVNKKLRENKKKYFDNYFNKFRNDSKKMWQGINLALDQTKHRKTLPTIVRDADGTNLDDPHDIANAFASYFQSVPDKTKLKINPSCNHYMDYLSKCRPIDSYLTLYDTNLPEVYWHINKLKDSSSPGPVSYNNKFLKMLSMPLSSILTCIINNSMRCGYVPKLLKTGKQTPVHKGGDTVVTNYRPITVCSSISKILEKVVRNRIDKYLKNINVLNSSQFGFRSKHSTNHAIINLAESTLESIENSLKVGGVFLDIAKAFDCVNHDILLRKLEYYGFRGQTLMWFQSYLSDRSQFVNIKGQQSNIYQLSCGVPQGGTLAPVLFIIFMNDIIKSSSVFDFSMYADDTCLVLGIEKSKYDDTMNVELKKVVDWFCCNDLMLNVKKTEYLNFGPHYNKCYIKGEYDMTELHQTAPLYMFINENADLHSDEPDHVQLNKKGEYVLQDLHKVCPSYFFNEFVTMPDGSCIFEPSNVKYLGLYFDNKLTFKRHIDILCCKINRMVGILWKAEHLSIKTKKTIYHSMVESHLNYGILMWGSNFSKNLTNDSYRPDHVPENLKKINSILNKVVRAIFRKPKYDKQSQEHTPSNPLYKELGILKLCDLYYYNLAIMVHEFYHSNSLPSKLSDKYTKKTEITNVCTRNNEHELYYTAPRLNGTYRKPTLASAAFWNTLPNELRTVKNKITFKNKLKIYLLEKYAPPI